MATTLVPLIPPPGASLLLPNGRYLEPDASGAVKVFPVEADYYRALGYTDPPKSGGK